MTKSYRHRLLFPTALALAALTASCGGDVTLPNPGEAANLRKFDGDEQVGPVGAELADPVIVQVLDTENQPVVNQDVTFLIASGGGSVEPGTATTDGDGLASTTWTLGPGAGAQQLRARTTQGGSGTLLEVQFSATGVAGSGSVLEGVRGDDQTGPVNSALGDSLVVRATDALGNPVANVSVTWSVSGGGSISPATVVTGTDGLAAAERVLGPTAGAQSAQATVEGFSGSPVGFSHTAQPANPTALVLVSGDDQSAPAGFEVALDLVVRLEDPDHNGIGGRPITWVVPAGSGSVSPVSVQTDANGFARTRWTMPSAVGEHSVSAVFSGLPPVVFTATATADAPTTIEMVSGNGQSAPVGTAVINPLVVRVTDASDNPVPGVPVAWVAVGGGSVSADNTPTDAQGLAQVNRTVGLVPGQYTTTASVDGLAGSPVTFVSTATVGAPAQLALIQAPGSPVVSGSTFSPAPQIEVRDAQGNPVPVGGIQVVATITSGQVGATLENDTRNTNVNGRVFFSALRISGPPDDDYVLTFSASFSGSPLLPVSTGPLVVTAGGATRLVLTQQPSTSAQSGVPFAQQPVVQVVDATGNPVAGERTIQVVIGSGGGTLEGTPTVSTGGGSTATFAGLAISGLVGSRTLIFSSGALTPVESNPIDVTTAPTTTTLDADPNPPSTSGTTVTLTATVQSDGGDPTGSVEFRDGGTAIGTDDLDGNGEAVIQVVLTDVGTHSLTAHYLGGGSFAASDSEELSYDIAAMNVAPVANPDGFSVSEDGTLNQTAPGVLANDTDANGDALTAQVMGGPPASGDLAFNANGSFTYTPDPDFNGIDQFTYRANDGSANSGTVTVTLTVNPVNDDPVFTPGGDVEVTTLEALAFSDQWATEIVPGPPNESAQQVAFDVILNNATDADAFVVPPQISADGILSFTALALVLTEPRVIPLTVLLSDDQGGNTDSVGLTLTIAP